MTKLNKEYIFIVFFFFSYPLRIPRVDRVYTLEKVILVASFFLAFFNYVFFIFKV